MKLLAYLMLFSGYIIISTASAQELEISELSEGVYLHKSFPRVGGFGLVDSNGLLVVEGGDAYIVDTPWSEADTKGLLDWAEQAGFSVKAAVVTHFHRDRTAGLELLNQRGIPTYAFALTQSILEERGEPLASEVFSSANYSMAEGLIETFYPGAGHTHDNLVIWLPKHQVLFGGCMLRSLAWQSLGNTADASIDQWHKSISHVLAKPYNAELVVPGHGDPAGGEILYHSLELAKKAVVKKSNAASDLHEKRE